MDGVITLLQNGSYSDQEKVALYARLESFAGMLKDNYAAIISLELAEKYEKDLAKKQK